jgi:hypothetical protein
MEPSTRNARSFRMIPRSGKSRRQLPTRRSATPFHHGLRKAVRVGCLPMFRGRNHIGRKLRVAVEWQESVRLFFGPASRNCLPIPVSNTMDRTVVD